MKQARLTATVAVSTTVFLFILIAGATTAGETPGKLRVKTISLGLVSAVAQKEVERHFQDFVDYVARRFSPASIEGKVVIAPTASQLTKLLEEKKVDFYMESPYPTYLINRQGAAVLILRRWKSGIGEYRGLVFTKSDSGATRLEDLRGKMIAFEDPGSTSGYFLPKVFLLRKGLTLTEKAGLDAKVAPNEIGYIFASTDVEVVNLVMTKRVAAGAFSNDDYATLEQKKRAEIVILAETEPFPRHLVSARKDLDPAVRNRLKEILLSMHQDDEGTKILRQMDNTTKFDPLPGGEEMMRRKLIELFRPRK
jgi:phosphonate transport system substrate-binding protein